MPSRLRLALQNLALGRPGFAEPSGDTAQRVEVVDPDYSPEMPGRLAKLEGAISKQRTVKFEYWAIGRGQGLGARAQPIRVAAGQRRLVRDRTGPRSRRHPHLPRVAHSRRDQVRDAPRARLPNADRFRHRAVPRPAAVAGRRHRRRGTHRGARRHRVVGPARLRRHRPPRRRRLRHRLLLPPAARLVGLEAGRPRGARSSPRSSAGKSRAR